MTNVGTFMSREPVTCGEAFRLQQVAALMRARHVGSVVVVSGDGLGRRPVGVITDRDIVIEVVATGLDAAAITAGDIVVRPAVTAHDTDSLPEAIQKMRSRGIQRLPVVDLHGDLLGVLSSDDVLQAISHELSTPVRVAEHQPAQEARARP
ncbi:MAG: CBS domain-containing protein [Betaproteobacteria bacterium]